MKPQFTCQFLDASNPVPSITTRDMVEYRLKAARSRSKCNVIATNTGYQLRDCNFAIYRGLLR